MRESSQKYNQISDNPNKLQEEKIHTLSNTNIIFDINGKDILENDDRNGQSLFYNEKDIQEDKELLDLFLINKDVEIKNSKYLLIFFLIHLNNIFKDFLQFFLKNVR